MTSEVELTCTWRQIKHVPIGTNVTVVQKLLLLYPVGSLEKGTLLWRRILLKLAKTIATQPFNTVDLRGCVYALMPIPIERGILVINLLK